MPADLHGTMSVEDIEGGCRYVMKGSVHVRVPFLGGRIEPAIANQLKALIRAEQAFAGRWLRRTGG